MRAGTKGGFTLIELLIVAVLGVVIVGATYQMILTSQRAHTIQTAQMQGQRIVRAGMDILFSEIREQSGPEGDILRMGGDRIRVRAMRSFGLVCNVASSGSPIRVKNMGRFFASGDSVVVFADNNPKVGTDDTILSGVVGSASTPLSESCTGADTAQSLAIPDLAAAMGRDTVRLGAPVRAFEVYEYGLYSIDGENYLARQSSSSVEPLVGPLSSNGVSFTYMDAFGNVTTDRTEISQIEVTLRSKSTVSGDRGPVADSLTTVIHLRN